MAQGAVARSLAALARARPLARCHLGRHKLPSRVVPVAAVALQQQGSGVITNISSNSVLIDYPYVAYKTSKAGVVALKGG